MHLLKLFIPQNEFNITDIQPCSDIELLQKVEVEKHSAEVARLSKSTEVQVSMLLLLTG